MRRKGSRYENTNAFDADKDFAGFRARKLSEAPGIVEHTLTENDRLDTLSHHYYQDDRRWWRLLDANNELFYGFELMSQEMNSEAVIIPAGKEKKS